MPSHWCSLDFLPPLFAKVLQLFGVTVMVLIWTAAPALGLLPPKQMQQKNLAAAEIIIGWVGKLHPAPDAWRSFLPPVPAGKIWSFTLAPVHVVKTSLGRGQTQELTVLYIAPEPPVSGLGLRQQGWSPVQVHPGDLVIVYANAVVQEGRVLLLPLLAGSSVICLLSAPSGL